MGSLEEEDAMAELSSILPSGELCTAQLLEPPEVQVDYWTPAKTSKEGDAKASLKAVFKLLLVARQPTIEVAGELNGTNRT